MKLRLGVVVLSVVVAMTMSGCSHQSESVAPTPSFASEDEAFAAAEQTYRNYVDALNRVDLSDPATFEEVYRWTTGELNASSRENFTRMHANQWSVGGDSVIVLIAPRMAGGKDLTSIELAVCVDVGDVTLVDPMGDSVVNPNRRDLQSTLVRATVSEASPTGWLLNDIVGRDGEPRCSE